MRVNSFSVFVPEGRERDSGHVELRHNTVYAIRLGNHGPVDCDADISVDGKEVGKFRIRYGCTMLLERPAADDGKFTFFEANSQQAQDAGAPSIAKDNRGLVQVVFRPERKRAEREQKTSGGIILPQGLMRSAGSTTTDCSFNASAGVTGLTGKSNQEFVEVPELDYEPNAEVTISLRLVCAHGVRELKSTPRSNPVPAAV